MNKALDIIKSAKDNLVSSYDIDLFKTVQKIKKTYNKVFGEGSYEKIAVPEHVKQSKAKKDINVSAEQKPEFLSAEKHHRHTVAKKRLAKYAGTTSHYAAGILSKVEEKKKGKKEEKLAASVNPFERALDVIKGIGGEGSRGGKIIGRTRTGKAIYDGHKGAKTVGFHNGNPVKEGSEHHKKLQQAVAIHKKNSSEYHEALRSGDKKKVDSARSKMNEYEEKNLNPLKFSSLIPDKYINSKEAEEVRASRKGTPKHIGKIVPKVMDKTKGKSGKK